MKKHSAAVVPDGLVRLVNENGFGIRNRDAIGIKCETRKPVVIHIRQNRIRTCVRVADNGTGIDGGVINKNKMIRREARMKHDAKQTGIVPALASVVNVE